MNRGWRRAVFAFMGLLFGMGASGSFPAASADETRLAMQNDLRHSIGRGGKGLCPQTRTVPQAPDDMRAKKNLLKTTPDNLAAGESLYQIQAEPTACKICHGANGNGIGMMAQGLSAMPRNFACAETMKGVSDGQLFWVIKNGSGGTGMPAYKFLDDEQIWKLILYLRQFAN